MRVLLFGTYDAVAHPRIAILGEGLRASGVEVAECNAPLGLGTAARVAMLAQPWRVPALLARLARRWLTLARSAGRMRRPDVVLVGYLGHFDVHLARLLFRGVPIVLDHLVSASGTGRDRRLDGGPRRALLRMIDAAALAAAAVVLVDTEEHRAALPERYRSRAVVVPVGAPAGWFAAAARAGLEPGGQADGHGPLRVVFYGLYTPLQGTPVIAAALSLITGAPIEVTMIGGGQDAAAARAAAAANAAVRWVDWVPAAQLPALVAAHDVCLGIFGTGDKALCVVPNKVFQGAAAGCAIITSDTAPQRRALGPAAVLVPPGDPRALADALLRLAADRAGLASLRGQAARRAAERFAAGQIVAPLLHRLRPAAGRPGAPPAADRAHPVSRPVGDAPAEDPLIR
jgi:glycosyltransferase involved in cell wall biosynthesis